MVELNLIPASVLASRARRRHIKGWIVATAVSLCALAIPIALDATNQAKASDLVSRGDRVSAKLESVRGSFKQTALHRVQLQGMIDRAKALRSKRTWSALIGLVGSSLPQDAYLSSIATDPAAPSGGGRRGRTLGGGAARGEAGQPSTVVIQAPRSLKIVGYVGKHEELYDFMRRLKSAGVFTDVKLTRSGSERRGSEQVSIGFEVICDW